ncbi:UNVERIFIED_CONTAM: hypothetical protein Slati_2046100 [Sesamum latifolium]|uniref:25S rRNA (uridine-N(3))-methyltransferase BMT5-like domain-containing protein n=1 Tax=Sesamum latifolium TaxID=2727402 RepID=A0AAW2WQI7_9LAMI
MFSNCIWQCIKHGGHLSGFSTDVEDKASNSREEPSTSGRDGMHHNHEVDAHSMCIHPLLTRRQFDRIVFNFPHAGFNIIFGEHDSNQISRHQDVVRGFLMNAYALVREDGEIHITHKTSYPFSRWKIADLAVEEGLSLSEEEEFDICDYPGYENKRGDGSRSNDTFPVGRCSTLSSLSLSLLMNL